MSTSDSEDPQDIVDDLAFEIDSGGSRASDIRRAFAAFVADSKAAQFKMQTQIESLQAIREKIARLISIASGPCCPVCGAFGKHRHTASRQSGSIASREDRRTTMRTI